jgi:menaquinone-9 beta-reductase
VTLHAAIIGAGPAGCSAAIHLARRGCRVTLIERKAFPRVKVCGEFISPAATENLESLLTPDELRNAGARTVDRLTFALGDRERTWTMPVPAWVLSRRALDDELVRVARRAGVDVRQPATVRTVAYHDNRVAVERTDAEPLTADLVIHADGSGRHDTAKPTPNRPGVIGLKCHIRPHRDAPIVGLRMHAGPGAYVGMVGVEHHEATVALVARTTVLNRHDNDRDRLLASLWPDYDPSTRTTPWLACGVAGSPYITPGHPRSFRLGNAAAAVEPVGGEGIGLALWSGHTLAHTLRTTPDPSTAQRTFAKAYRQRLRVRRPACRAAAETLMRPTLVNLIWPALAHPTFTLRPWYTLTGKPV